VIGRHRHGEGIFGVDACGFLAVGLGLGGGLGRGNGFRWSFLVGLPTGAGEQHDRSE
jgi:hypothetical protein